MRRYLLIANATVTGAEAQGWVPDLVAGDRSPAHVHVVVPATPVSHALTWTEGESRARARERLAEVVATLGRLGLPADGEVGDASPVLAATDALLEHPYDAVLAGTTPIGPARRSRWNVVNRLRRRVGVPVLDVAATPAVAAVAA